MQPFLVEIVQTSHTSIIFSVTPIASFISGTGMRDAADCNNVKACFPVAVIYFAVEGMISRGFSDNSWIHMCVREMGGKESILSHRRLGICLHNSILHRLGGTFLRCRDDSY